MNLRAGFVLGWLLLPLGAAGFVACADSTPPPGFEPVGGAGEGGAGGADASNNNVSSTSSSPSSPSSSSSGNVTSSNSSSSSSSSTSTATSSSTGTGGLNCNDMQAEPNETESTAEDLGTIDDCDGSGDTVSGILAGVGDTDWYKYSGTDSFGCSVDPSRQLTSSDPISVCKYAQCPDNDESFTCPAGSTDATSPDGRPGCCSNTGFEFGFSCGSSINSDEAVIYIRLETNTNDCVTYSLTYHY